MPSTSAGSTGIGGSPDRVAVLARGRGEADGELSITGRDVTEEARVRHLRVAHIRQYGRLVDPSRGRTRLYAAIGWVGGLVGPMRGASGWW